MVRKIIFCLGIAAILLPLGCTTPRPYPWSWAHNKRRLNTMLGSLEGAAEEFDRIFFQDITTFPDKMYQANLDFDRIVFDMDERSIEDL